MGVPDQAMRDLDEPGPHGLARRSRPATSNAIKAQNALFGAGQIGQQPTAGPVELSFPVVTQRPFADPRQYENIILRASQDGSAIVRLGDVARAEVGLRQYIVDCQAQRRAGDLHRRLPAARRQRLCRCRTACARRSRR